MSGPPKTVIIGLGSPIMTDDAVGLKVSETVGQMGLENVDALQEAIGGLDILPMIHNYEFAIIVDAIQTFQYEPGTVMIFNPEDFDSTIVDASAHDVNLATAIRIGRQMEPDIMPKEIRFIAVEIEDMQTMSEEMTPRVAAAVKPATDAVLHILNQLREGSTKDRSP